MSFVSYAQNFEDVMLWRALKHVQNGVYVDVGAQHPIIDSVSKAFYEQGWRGIHIEPVPYYAELLSKDRPDETVLQVALADAEGVLELNVIPDTGLSTAVDAYAQRHQVERGYDLQRVQVPVLTLKAATKSLEGKDVHWLKIDVEGLEEKVLKGWDSRTLRPWVIVVEATIPNSPETDYASWDPILTAADYQFVYFDGLNRFYVAKEHAELAEAFSCPPNVFDGVELSGLASSQLCRKLIASHQASDKEMAAQAQWLQNEWDAAKQRIEELSKSKGELEVELAAEQAKATNLAFELNAANEHNTQLQAHVPWLQNQLNAASAKVHELNHASHHWWTVAADLNQEQKTFYASRSWRITKPLRLLSLAIKKIITGILVIPKGLWLAFKFPFKLMLAGLIGFILKRPTTQAWAITKLRKYPRLEAHLCSFASSRGIPLEAAVFMPGVDQNISATHANIDTDISQLSQRARRIYQDLKVAMEQQQTENT
jgi:FkbM family methyltransferase